MRQTIVTAQGVFSKFEITLNQDTLYKLSITKDNNPLKPLKEEMETLVRRFEMAYMEMNSKEV